MNRCRMLSFVLSAGALALAIPERADAAGVLVPNNAADPAPALVDHQVHVVLNNGFARTEVLQTFQNDGAAPIDAVYEFPVPPDAALSEMTIEIGERTLSGEVVERERAEELYTEAQSQGEQAGIAAKDGFQNFRFAVANIPAASSAVMRFVYYEKLSIDSGVGRYLYPLEDGHTDESSFWTPRDETAARFSFDLELKTAAPVDDVRMPDAPGALMEELGEGHRRVHWEAAPGDLTTDLVFYYRLRDDLPGGVELVPYRPEGGALGTFLLVLTPGVDLAPLDRGSDYVFVLDVSGSMQGKLSTLVEATIHSIDGLGPDDRFRLVVFSDLARDVSGGFLQNDAENRGNAAALLRGLVTEGGTNLYAGLTLGLADDDADRVTSIFLVTDGVTNEGVVDPIAFDQIMRQSDRRLFGFLLGNNANWPLMDIVTDASGGFYAAVSNQDDIEGQVLLAKSKITHESLHDARLTLNGVPISETTDFDFGKVYRGQQLVVFGRYAGGGDAVLELEATISGKKHAYSASLPFPDTALDDPELERLWALEMIHAVEKQRLLGLMPAAEATNAVRDLGLAYQLVTDETSMIVLDDAAFDEAGIERDNAARTAVESDAQARKDADPAVDQGVGAGTPPASGNPGASSGATPGSSGPSYPTSGYSHDDDERGGALDPLSVALGLMALLLGAAARRRAGAVVS